MNSSLLLSWFEGLMRVMSLAKIFATACAGKKQLSISQLVYHKQPCSEVGSKNLELVTKRVSEVWFSVMQARNIDGLESMADRSIQRTLFATLFVVLLRKILAKRTWAFGRCKDDTS